MRKNYQLRIKLREPIVQYHGKWPFVRIAGIQEIASVIFSFGNLIPHTIGLWRIVAHFRQVSYSWLYLLLTIFGIVSWTSSIIFHTRDIYITELMDYFSANLFLVFIFVTALVRTINLSRNSILFVLSATVIFYAQHMYYMLFIHFNYQYNGILMVIISALSIIIWIIWCIKIKRTYAWRMVAALVSTSLAASMEAFDFPPYYDIIDAHSLWHLFTIVPTALLHSFIHADLKYEKAKKDKTA